MSSEIITTAGPSSSTAKARKVGQPGNCNNKAGKNQYKDRPLPDDPRVAAALKIYHRKGIIDGEEVSKLLLEEHGIVLGETSVKRRQKKLGLQGSQATTLKMSESAKRQLILEQMAKDPKGKLGARMIKQGIFEDTGIQLTRDYIREEMRKLDPESYSKRGPRHMKAKRLARLAQEAERAPASSTHGQHASPPTAAQQDSCFFDGSSPPRAMDIDHDSDNELLPPFNDAPQTFPNFNVPSVPETQIRRPPPSSLSSHPHRTSHSPSFATALTLVQATLPQMTSLIQVLNEADSSSSSVQMDQQAYDAFIKGMEAAALLERQFSRIISKARLQS